MRYLFTFFWAVVLRQMTWAQYLPNESFAPLTTVPCPANPMMTAIQPEGWEIYQTTNGQWNGPRDSTRCFDLQPEGFSSARLHLGLVDPSEALFVRAQLDDFFPAAPFLQPDYLFFAGTATQITPDTTPVRLDVGCPQGICTGLLVGIAIPDSFGTPAGQIRWQTGLAQPSYGNLNFVDVATCYPTEYFPDQFLREFILKFTFDSTADLSQHWLRLSNAYTFPIWWDPNYITEVVAGPDNFNNGVYTVSALEASGGNGTENYLMRYTASTYPDAQHPSFVEARIEPNLPDPQTILLTVEEYQTLEIQPFTALRGALVEGSDSVRHSAVLQNNGGDFCLNFIDLIFSGGDEYRHSGGTVTTQNPLSCMQFRGGSALRVTEGATLRYGADGAGMLAFCAAGRIILERDALLVIDGILQMSDCELNPVAHPVSVELGPGATLQFTENAWLTNRFSPDGRLLLEVSLLGGVLDDTALSPEERALIRRVYPEPSAHFGENVTVAPNPFETSLTVRYLAGTNETATLYWTNITGQVVYQETRSVLRGWNEWRTDPPVAAGIYLFTVESASGKTTKKVMKI